MSLISTLLKYVLATLVVVIGVAGYIGSAGSLWTILIIIAGVLIMPPIKDRAARYMDDDHGPLNGLIFAIIAVGFFFMSFEVAEENRALAEERHQLEIEFNIEYFRSNREEILASITTLIDQRNYVAAKSVIDVYVYAGDEQLNRLADAVDQALYLNRTIYQGGEK